MESGYFTTEKIALSVVKSLQILLTQKDWMPDSDTSEFDRGEYMERSYESILFELQFLGFLCCICKKQDRCVSQGSGISQRAI